MKVKTVRRIACVGLVVLLSLGIIACRGSLGFAGSSARRGVEWFTEAYIHIWPFSSAPKPLLKRPVFPDRDEVAIEVYAPAKEVPTNPVTPVEKKDDGKAALVEEVYADVTLYRIEDTDFFMIKPLGVNRDTQSGLKNGTNFLNDLAAKNGDVDFYAYYITRAEDYNWYSGYDFFDYPGYVEKAFSDSGLVKFGCFKLADLSDYFATGYKTDFHVNNRGSHRIYQEIYAMLSEKENLSPQAELLTELSGGWKMVGDLFSNEAYMAASLTPQQMDDFRAYVYSIPEYKSFIYDTETKLGMEEEYAANEIPDTPRFGHQFIYYGGQTGEIRLEFNQPDKKNLLIISDSQGRPSRLPIASHFNTTVYLDDFQVRRLDVNEIIDKYDIDVVLFMGQRSMFEFYE